MWFYSDGIKPVLNFGSGDHMHYIFFCVCVSYCKTPMSMHERPLWLPGYVREREITKSALKWLTKTRVGRYKVRRGAEQALWLHFNTNEQEIYFKYPKRANRVLASPNWKAVGSNCKVRCCKASLEELTNPGRCLRAERDLNTQPCNEWITRLNIKLSLPE